MNPGPHVLPLSHSGSSSKFHTQVDRSFPHPLQWPLPDAKATGKEGRGVFSKVSQVTPDSLWANAKDRSLWLTSCAGDTDFPGQREVPTGSAGWPEGASAFSATCFALYFKIQVVEISSLTEHLLTECDKKDGFGKCYRCSEAVFKEELPRHIKNNECNREYPFPGSRALGSPGVLLEEVPLLLGLCKGLVN